MNRSRRAEQALLMLLVCILGWVLTAQRAHAAVVCTATMTDLNFGSADLVAGVGLSTNGTLNYTCTNDANSATNVRVCFNVGDGNESLGFFNPRRMKSGTNVLQFQIYQNGGSPVWGSNGNATVPSPFTTSFSIPRRPGGNGTVTSISGSTTMQGQLVPGQGAAPAGNYQDFYSSAGGHTAISWSNANSAPGDCNTISSGDFPFIVRATVVKSCTVTAGMASDIQLGAASGVNFTDTNLMGNNTISVTCSGGTPYYIGLRPSNNNTGGAGVMAALNLAPVTGNTNSVPYQLRSTPGMTGTLWGNTATGTSVSNGKSGTGTGTAQAITVYATTPGANFVPDSYADTVTVNVNY
jgi:spore coat protein U-like protein